MMDGKWAPFSEMRGSVDEIKASVDNVLLEVVAHPSRWSSVGASTYQSFSAEEGVYNQFRLEDAFASYGERIEPASWVPNIPTADWYFDHVGFTPEVLETRDNECRIRRWYQQMPD